MRRIFTKQDPMHWKDKLVLWACLVGLLAVIAVLIWGR